MKYLREYKADVPPAGTLHIGVNEKNHWFVELKGKEWKPIQSSEKPIWIDNRKWEKIPEKLGIDAGQWAMLRAEIQEKEAEAESEQTEDKEEFPEEIKAKANEVLSTKDPMAFFLDVYNTIHVGDRDLGQIMLCCVGSQHCENSQGLHPKLSGESGMGKSDAIETFLHLMPKAAYIKTSLSSKAIFYHDIKPGTIIFLDDYKQNDDLDSIIKQTSSDFHKPYEHRTIDKDREAQILTAPPAIVWAITSVDTSQDIQVLNRQVGLDVDSSPEMTKKVIQHLFKAAGEGRVRFPEEDDVLVCRAIVADIKSQCFKVIIPYWDRIEWKDLSSRRNPSIFLDILKSMTIWRYRQRSRDGNTIIASEQDFEDAKALYIGKADTLIDKLTKAERRLVIAIVDANGEIYKDQAATQLGVSCQRISQLIHGENGKTGLLQKLPGFSTETVTIKEDVRNIQKMNLLFSEWRNYQRLRSYGNVVSLKPIAGDGEKNERAENLTQKGSKLTETFNPTESKGPTVSKVSIFNNIREGKLSSNGEIKFSLYTPKTPYDPYVDIKRPKNRLTRDHGVSLQDEQKMLKSMADDAKREEHFEIKKCDECGKSVTSLYTIGKGEFVMEMCKHCYDAYLDDISSV